MKKTTITSFIAISLALVSLPALAACPTCGNSVKTNSTTSAPELIQQLQQQIATLNAQIAALQSQLGQVKEQKQEIKEQVQEIKGTLKLSKQLRYGMSGDDIKMLQELLATDPDIYPEGKITGFYGWLTQKAIRRFQEKFCLQQIGNVGPKTMERINELLTEGAGNSGKIPPGLLTAPGIRKKMGCSTTTPDTVAPVISNVVATSTGMTSSVITWTTDELANSRVYYGTSNPVLINTSTLSVVSANKVLQHSLTASGLTANTAYYYIVVSADAYGNTATSAQYSFTTLAIPDTVAPVISGIGTASTSATSVAIVWTTNEAADSKVWYGTSTPLVVSTSTPMVSSTNLVLSHNLAISGLTASTTYYYMIASADASLNNATTTEYSFMTLGL